jgi:pimeloyl-ACP methyl ester carboxylesterase
MDEAGWKTVKAINEKAFEIIVHSTDTVQLKTDLTEYLKQALKDHPTQKPQGISEEQFIQMSVSQMTSPWMILFIKYDPAFVLEKMKCPVLALNGERDLQVSAKENLEAIKTALTKGGNKQVTTKEFPGLNHFISGM